MKKASFFVGAARGWRYITVPDIPERKFERLQIEAIFFRERLMKIETLLGFHEMVVGYRNGFTIFGIQSNSL